jgi:hypothetical protein
MKFRIDAFIYHIPNINFKMYNIQKEAKTYYKNNLKLVDNLNKINILKKLQHDHKIKFFKREPRASKGNKFFEKNKILDL